MAKKRVVYVVNHVAFFVSHRMPLAIWARLACFDVRLLKGLAGSAVMEEASVAQLQATGVMHR
jgi:hypothetical protein